MQAAIIDSNLTLVKKLINSKKVNIQTPDSNGSPIIFDAIKYDKFQIFEYLLSKTNAIQYDFSKNNSLIIASKYKNIPIFELYLSKFPNSLNEKNNDGDSALIIACRSGLKSIVSRVLDLSSSLNDVDFKGNTLLHIACEYGYFEIIAMLVDKGITITKNNDGFYASDYCFDYEVVDYLEVCLINKRGNMKMPLRSIARTISVSQSTQKPDLRSLI